mmetsp:Transcript_16346/g.43257  ORF Transcript_16346/g.43257 Transcript_16346/m.43257 type:complete len:276 (-) Transcript_16346:126-953(-)
MAMPEAMPGARAMPEAAHLYRKQKLLIASACVQSRVPSSDAGAGPEGQGIGADAARKDPGQGAACAERRSGGTVTFAPGSTPRRPDGCKPAWLRKWSARLQTEGESCGRARSDSDVLRTVPGGTSAGRCASEPADARQGLLHAGLHRKRRSQGSLCMEALAEELEEIAGDGSVSIADLSTCDERNNTPMAADEGASHASAPDSEPAPLAEAPAWYSTEGSFVSGHALLPGLRWASPVRAPRSRARASPGRREGRAGARHRKEKKEKALKGHSSCL